MANAPKSDPEIRNILPEIASGLLSVRVRAGARQNAVKLERDVTGAPLLRVQVTEVAEKGRANEAVIGLLSSALGVPRSRLSIVAGHTSRDKKVRIETS